MPCPPEIEALVERFTEHYDTYKNSYNEAQVRRDFIDPFLRALGWDVDNNAGHAEAYREVVVEDALRSRATVTAPDYSIRVGGVRKFFVEAKRPHVYVREDVPAAFQLRRYGWSAKLQVSVLTDFEEFAVYDCNIEPKRNDPASTARLMYLRFTDYVDRWDEISEVFSRDAVWRGRFDKYAAAATKHRGTATVDVSLLETIRRWRTDLSKSLARGNPTLAAEDLNYVVQATIDRIMFLRICEDRQIERYGELRDVAGQKDAYEALKRLFIKADHRYNSGLFHFRAERGRPSTPDELSLSVDIDDRTLQSILRSLYFPESPFEFSVLPADILGQIYEQFLGETVRLTPGRTVKVEVKPEVRKVGGVYYTPSSIVRLIVDATVGAELRGVTSVESLRRRASRSHPVTVLDPACGSGSFLIEAYQTLLDWYLAAYSQDAQKWSRGRNSTLVPLADGSWRLTPDERRRILVEHIFGVDVDPQAVEVTKLSLLLKVLEGETDETVTSQLRLFHARALPDLDRNIRCGNSLLGPDFFNLAGIATLDDALLERLNPFDWDAQFGAVMGEGGFTAVIGNPPYVLMQNAGLPLQEQYLGRHYRAARYKIDTYMVFMERALQLLRRGGRLGFITPSSFLLNKYAESLRDLLLEAAHCELLHINLYPVFRGASVDTTVSIWAKGRRVAAPTRVVMSSGETNATDSPPVSQESWKKTPSKAFLVLLNDTTRPLVDGMERSSVRLGDFATAYFGIQTYDRTVYVGHRAVNRSWKPALDGANINRYELKPPHEFVNTAPDAIKSGGDARVYEQQRIGVRQIGSRPIAALLPAGWYSLNTIYNIYPVIDTPFDLRFVLAVLNSDVVAEYWRVMNHDYKPTFPKVKKEALLSLPVPDVDFDAPTDVALHGRICGLVDDRMRLGEERARATRPQQLELLTRRIVAAEAQLEADVRQAYRL
jgi:hypothetical protein